MYEAARALPAGESTVARLASAVADAGFDGVVVRNPHDAAADYDAAAVREATGVDVVRGVTVNVDDPQTASGHVGQLRPTHDVVVVAGGSPSMNRYAVENHRVDVLASPMRGEGDVNHVLARAAADNDVHLEFDLSRVLRQEGGGRVRAISGLRKLRELVEQYDAPHVVSARPRSHLQVRTPRELVAVGERVGIDEATVREGLAAWGDLAARNRRRRDADFIAPGVERGRHETER